MKKLAFVSLAVLAVLAILAAACGGDDGDTAPEIRTQKGLSVAAVAQEMSRQSTTGEDASGGSVTGDMIAPGIAPDTTTKVDRSALGAPAFQQASDGITVLGYGSASADADSAVVEFYFGRGGGFTPEPDPGDSSSGSGSSRSVGTESRGVAAQEAQPITEADLQPVIDALVGAGVPRENIELLDPGYYDPYFASATLRATINDISAVDSAVTAAQNAAASLGDIQVQSTNISYTLQDCAALERAATEAAVDDANSRARMTAEVLGVGLGAVTGASNYSYAPYGGTPCGSSIYGPYPLGGVAYAEGGSRTVEVFAQISVTYGIQ